MGGRINCEVFAGIATVIYGFSRSRTCGNFDCIQVKLKSAQQFHIPFL